MNKPPCSWSSLNKPKISPLTSGFKAVHVVGSFIHSCSFYIIVYEFLLIFGSWIHYHIFKYCLSKLFKKIYLSKTRNKNKLKCMIGYSFSLHCLFDVYASRHAFSFLSVLCKAHAKQWFHYKKVTMMLFMIITL